MIAFFGACVPATAHMRLCDLVRGSHIRQSSGRLPIVIQSAVRKRRGPLGIASLAHMMTPWPLQARAAALLL